MFASKYSNQKRPRFSESRQGEKKVVSTKKNSIPNNRSTSINRQKKHTRFNTEYDEYQDIHTANGHNFNKFQKKVISRRRDTYDQYLPEEGPRQLAVHSTKYNPTKNLDLKALFGRQEEKDKSVPRKNKSTHNNHPLLKFMGKKVQQEKRQSFCARPKQPRNLSQHSNDYSLSAYKQKKQSVPKRQHQLLIDKNQISLRDEKQKEQKQSEGPFVPKTQQGRRESSVKPVKKDDQWTVKTIKKQQKEDIQVNESVMSNESYGLTQQEEETFGDRFPYGFEKIKLLGRGGFSLVWLGRHIKSGREFAIKQIITQNTHQTHIKEIWFGSMFFSLGGIPKPEFARFPGVKNLVRLYSYEINQTDTWIFYEKCGQSLGSTLYDIRSEKLYGDQKLYKIHYRGFYIAMAENPKLLLSLIIEICKPLALLSDNEVVHSDLKTENILIRFSKEGKDTELKEVKLIDYGSSFEFRNLAQFSMATPEYMPPQILNYIIHENGGQYEEDLYQRVMNDYRNPWAVDMWSLGCVVLQIVVGVPLWMSLPLLVPSKNGSWLQKEGLFAVKGRLFPQIIKKQRSINPLLEDILEKDNYSRINLSPLMRKTVRRMLQVDFNKRISPQEVIQILQKQIALS